MYTVYNQILILQRGCFVVVVVAIGTVAHPENE